MEESKGDTASATSASSYEVVAEASDSATLDQGLRKLTLIRQTYGSLRARLPTSTLPDLPFPTVAVIGNQNSGKSTLIEALTKIKLPTADELCTRRAIVVNSHPSHLGEGYFTFGEGKEHLTCDELLVKLEEANAPPPGTKNAFVKEPIYVDSYQPGAARFQIVDTPGLTESSGKVTDADKLMLNNLILGIISPESSFIIEVVEWNQEAAAGNLAHRLALKADPDHKRTCTLYTKCEVHPSGQDSKDRLRGYIQAGSAYFVAVKDVDSKVMLSNDDEVRRLEEIVGTIGPTVGQDAFKTFLGRQLVKLMKANMPAVTTGLNTVKVVAMKKSAKLGVQRTDESRKHLVLQALSGNALAEATTAVMKNYEPAAAEADTASTADHGSGAGSGSGQHPVNTPAAESKLVETYMGFNRALAAPVSDEEVEQMLTSNVFEDAIFSLPNTIFQQLVQDMAESWLVHTTEIMAQLRSRVSIAVAELLAKLPTQLSDASVDDITAKVLSKWDELLSELENYMEEQRTRYLAYRPVPKLGDKIRALCREEFENTIKTGARADERYRWTEADAIESFEMCLPGDPRMLRITTNAYRVDVSASFAEDVLMQLRDLQIKFRDWVKAAEFTVAESPERAEQRRVQSDICSTVTELLVMCSRI